MLRRCKTWDYRERCIYMVTFCTEGRLPLLGRLVGDETHARIELSDAGRIVEQCWLDLPSRYPQVALLEHQIMPDHFHGILFVRERLPKPMGSLIGMVKAHSSSLYLSAQAPSGFSAQAPHTEQSAASCEALAPNVPCEALAPNVPCEALAPNVPYEALAPNVPCEALAPRLKGLWSPGFQDTILFHEGQLAKMRAYVLDNPRRLAVKRAHPELFRIVRDLPLCGTTFAAIGNHFLLERPERLQIQCSRSITPEELAEKQEHILALCRHGAVAVSPCISPGEKQIAHAVMEANLPLIVLLENGFPPMYKPPGKYFEACSEGRLLMLAPWQYHTERRTITREQCLQLNEYTRLICL